MDRNVKKDAFTPVQTASPSSQRAWIEITTASSAFMPKMSPSSQRAWIEIFGPYYPFKVYEVALLAEGVDRNSLDPRSLGR